jgi:hypothetical protein
VNAIISRHHRCLHPSPSSLRGLFFANAILLPFVAVLPSAVTASTVAVLHATAAPNQSCNPLFDLPTMYANPTLQNRCPPVRPPNGIFAEEPKHPSRGGRPWPIEIRDMVIAMHMNGDDFWDANLARMCTNYKFSLMKTVGQWICQYNFEGTALPKHAIGNRHSTWEVNGVDLINLTLFRLVRPKVYLDEVRAYMHNRNPATSPYSQSQIVRVEHRLDLTRKAASSTSDRAHLSLNMHIRYLY